MKKYELTEETRVLGNTTLHRIRALKDFADVKAGDVGGWIEGERNLSHNSESWVYGNAMVWGNAEVCEKARVCENAMVYGNAMVLWNSMVCGGAMVRGNAEVCKNASLYRPSHVLVIETIGSRNDSTTFYRAKNKQIMVKCGCFLGNIEDFLKKVEETHGDNKHARVYRAAAELAKLQIDLE